jgi:hypothetical protein
LIEVKSTVDVKDVHIQDVAFQALLLANVGLRVGKCWIMHLNRPYIRRGELKPEELFIKQDVTEAVEGLSRSITDKIEELQKTLGAPLCPDVRIGPHCDSPFTCPLHERCWSTLPEHNVTELYRGKKHGFDLLNREIVRISEIPESEHLTAIQRIQKDVVRNGEPHIQEQAIQRFLKEIKFPAYFLDFETFQMALPPYDGANPWQQIPFEFSLHVIQSFDAQIEHHLFLAEGVDDPRPEFLLRLKKVLGKSGSIIAFNAQFEKRVLRESSDYLAQYSAWVRETEKRFVDLLIPFRAFRYYHPAQRGSASMKAVLPALVGDSYDTLEIREGGTASLEFCRIAFGEVTDAEVRRVRRNLEVYCSQDTLGMVKILRALQGLCAK